MVGVWTRIRWLGRTATGGASAVAAGGLIALVRAYQLTISPLLIGSCKFSPTCSEYFVEAVRTHGCLRGSLMGLWRICRCNPFNEGGVDPVPPPRSRPPRGESGPAD